jgi:hypothetical protein
MAPPAAVSALASPSSSIGRKRTAASGELEQHQQHNLQQLRLEDMFRQPILNEYELQRQQRIERNRQIMQQLGVDQAAAAVQASMNGSKRQRTANKKKVSSSMSATSVC